MIFPTFSWGILDKRCDLLKMASEMNIKRALEIITSVQNKVTEWAKYAEQVGMPIGQIDKIEKLINP